MINTGEILKSNREARKISIEKVSEELKISKDVLIEIESDEIKRKKDIIFYIGHIRSYSNFLKLNSNEIIKNFKEQISYNKNDNVKELAKPTFQNHSFTIQKIFPVTLILIVFSTFYILFINEKENSLEYALIPELPEIYTPIIEKTNLQNSEENLTKLNDQFAYLNNEINFTTAKASNKTNGLDNGDIITLKILNPTWLQIRDESNNIILSKLMEKNDEYTYEMKLEYNITAGNGGNILVLIDKDVRGKIGKYGEVVDSIILDNNFNN